MCQSHQHERYILCKHCDLLVDLPVLEIREKACCPRCHATLTVCWDVPRSRLNAYSLAALLMLLLACMFPFISMNVTGIVQEISLAEIPRALFSENYAVLSWLFLLLVLLLPASSLIIMLLLINPLPLATSLKIHLARILFWLKNWCMPEIFMAAVLVSFVKLMAYGEIAIGSSFWPMGLFCLLLLRAFQCLDKYWLWQRIAPLPPVTQPLHVGQSALRQGLRLCGCCHAILPVTADRCPRCQAKGQPRRKHSMQWTMALLITAIMLYLPANLLPMMSTEFLGSKGAATILSGVLLLWEEGAWPVALVIFIASIVVPCLKMIAIGWLCWDAGGYGRSQGARMHLIYMLVEFVGRWSMIDVFVIAILSALVQVGSLLHVYPASGALIFAVVVVITMFASLSFDPRLNWDRTDEQYVKEQVTDDN